MEREFKWNATGKEQFRNITQSKLLKPMLGAFDRIEMEAIYYDTKDKKIAKAHGGLRLRRENTDKIVCLKLEAVSKFGGVCKEREEYEYYAADIRSGLLNLPSVGAPQEFCDSILKSDLIELGRSDCVRDVYILQTDTVCCELSFDSGFLKHRGRTAPVCEIELEYKSGDLGAFDALAMQLQEEFSLEPQPLSKLARIFKL